MKMRKLLFKVGLGILTAAGCSNPVAAQNFLSLTEEPAVAVHKTRAAGNSFGDGSASTFAFHLSFGKLPLGVGKYDAKPNCTASAVRHAPVVYDSSELAWFDMVVYSYEDNRQVARAEAWELPTAPYLEGDLYNPYRSRDLQQSFLRVFDIRCLPTRFHYITLNGERVLEYREGERAWDK